MCDAHERTSWEGSQIREDMAILRNMTYERSDEIECVHVGMDRVEDFERRWIRHAVLESNRWSSKENLDVVKGIEETETECILYWNLNKTQSLDEIREDKS